MPTSKPLDFTAVEKAGWKHQNKKLKKDYQFEDFGGAVGFMAMAALGIEKRDHHPEWTNVYDRVSVSLSTHDAGKVTAKDIDLAVFLDHIAARIKAKKK